MRRPALAAADLAVAVAFATSDTINCEADATADESGLELIMLQICVAMSFASVILSVHLLDN